jgi:uncharacterized membrane protein YfcA
MSDPFYVASGFVVGVLVGMTGVGGGSLMTPLLILLFGIHPATAVGTDLLYAAATKTVGGAFHSLAKCVNWPVVIRLSCGSIPASVLTLTALAPLHADGGASRTLINLVLCVALVLTSASLVFRGAILASCRGHLERMAPKARSSITLLVGIVLGVLVSISSVGAGAVGVTALLLLYPELPMKRIVGSDIVHAVPLTLVAGIGHWATGSIDWSLLGVLLVGSLPGILVGSFFIRWVPEAALRLALAATLMLISVQLASRELPLPFAAVTASANTAR